MTLEALPPGQRLVAPDKWPVVGERQPAPIGEPWVVSLSGCVIQSHRWTLDELAQRPRIDQIVDIHCVTRWSKPNVMFRGILLERLLDDVEMTGEAKFISFVSRSNRKHSTSLSVHDALSLNTLVAFEANGEKLSEEHGGPVRIVVPGRYFYKSLKWLTHIELLAVDRLGYWEDQAGYHNTADPWQEQRFIARGISKQETARLIESRDFSGQDLLGISAAGRDLARLDARDALLRNADFRRCDLREARFDRANLSNAHFEQADLRNASFTDSDFEGADFSGADLRGADLRACSFVGVTFCDRQVSAEARFDSATKINESRIDDLTPDQIEFVRRFPFA